MGWYQLSESDGLERTPKTPVVISYLLIPMADKCGVEVIIKLGGSAVTQKNVFETVKREAILAAAELVKRIPAGKCIVIHGAGYVKLQGMCSCMLCRN